MKAARLNEPGQPLVIEEVDEPRCPPGGVKVRVERALVPSFTAAIMSGKMPFPLPTPYTPGPSCVGVVEEVGPGSVGISVGQRVFCAAVHSANVNGGAREEILVGWFGVTPGCGPLLEQWKNGSFAEKAVYPVDCVTPVGEDAAKKLIAIGSLSIAHGALLRGELQPGMSVLVNGGTGNLGSAAVLVALAMGASRVYAAGRSDAMLDRLQAVDPARVIPVHLTGDDTAYATQLGRQVEGVDVVIDALGYVMSPVPTLAALSRLRPGGTGVFMGGVLVDVPISYPMTLGTRTTIRGSFMHPPSTPATVLKMVRSGLIDVERFEPVAFPLSRINEAIGKARELHGLSCCVIALER